METTFISIHNLEEDARILYTSDSIIDILGYTPDDVVNRSAWDFFHSETLPYARDFHRKRVSQDKAAVLVYCKIKDKWNQYVGCECVFTVVYDVMVVCTSIYQRGLKSDKRAEEAPIVRRTFASSPEDPRYHMLSHLSVKFAQPAKAQAHEPRAALFLNRFTRTLTIMYATSGVQDILGISSEHMRGRSFYYCIAENCLPEAVKCLENAKGNDSVAYLRFWFRDPRQDDPPPAPEDDSDEDMDDDTETLTTETSMGTESASAGAAGGSETSRESQSPAVSRDESAMDIDDETKPVSRNSSGDSTQDTHEAIFGEAPRAESSASSLPDSPAQNRQNSAEPIELEAVISCASDGLVVCLRRARPMVPHPTHRPSKPAYENGLFAAPWGMEPMVPPIEARPGAGFGTSFAPALGPHGARHHSISPPRGSTGGVLDQGDFMNAIRDQAVFAWAIGGINGSLTEYGKGASTHGSFPQNGVPIWESDPRHAGTSSSSSASSPPINGHSHTMAPHDHLGIGRSPSALAYPPEELDANGEPVFRSSNPPGDGSDSMHDPKGKGNAFPPR